MDLEDVHNAFLSSILEMGHVLKSVPIVLHMITSLELVKAVYQDLLYQVETVSQQEAQAQPLQLLCIIPVQGLLVPLGLPLLDLSIT